MVYNATRIIYDYNSYNRNENNNKTLFFTFGVLLTFFYFFFYFMSFWKLIASIYVYTC